MQQWLATLNRFEKVLAVNGRHQAVQHFIQNRLCFGFAHHILVVTRGRTVVATLTATDPKKANVSLCWLWYTHYRQHQNQIKNSHFVLPSKSYSSLYIGIRF